MAGGNDMPQTGHRGRLLPLWKGQGEKMILPDYGENSHNSEREVSRQKLEPKEKGSNEQGSRPVSLLTSNLHPASVCHRQSPTGGQRAKSLVTSSIKVNLPGAEQGRGK